MLNRSTPKTLREALFQVFTIPGNKLRLHFYGVEIMESYLVAKFAEAILKHPECEPALLELLKSCVEA